MDEEYYEIVNPILNSKEFQKRKKYAHHGKITVYSHCLKVSKIAYKIAKKLKMDYKSVAIGGLLHDFYDKPWQSNRQKVPFFKKHGFVHAEQALINAKKKYPNYINDKVENIIQRHMFPLNITPPKYKEAWLVSFVDKLVSSETLLEPTFFLALIGIKRRR